LPHPDKTPPRPRAARRAVCDDCGKTYDPETSTWDVCLECLDRQLSQLSARELQDVPGPVLAFFNLKEEYFRD